MKRPRAGPWELSVPARRRGGEGRRRDFEDVRPQAIDHVSHNRGWAWDSRGFPCREIRRGGPSAMWGKPGATLARRLARRSRGLRRYHGAALQRLVCTRGRRWCEPHRGLRKNWDHRGRVLDLIWEGDRTKVSTSVTKTPNQMAHVAASVGVLMVAATRRRGRGSSVRYKAGTGGPAGRRSPRGRYGRSYVEKRGARARGDTVAAT